jgi:hypothetical protein
MTPAIDKLLSIASEPLVRQPPVLSADLRKMMGSVDQDLLAMLAGKNGFFAFESALHVFPVGRHASPYNLEEWNIELHREYGEMADGLMFWAEDIFGCQFVISDGQIGFFDLETGRVRHLAQTLEDWANLILAEYALHTGYPLAKEWQKQNRPLEEGERLVPKLFFVGGGEYAVDNLYASDAVAGMRVRAHLAREIKDLPDGARVRIKVTD